MKKYRLRVKSFAKQGILIYLNIFPQSFDLFIHYHSKVLYMDA